MDQEHSQQSTGLDLLWLLLWRSEYTATRRMWQFKHANQLQLIIKEMYPLLQIKTSILLLLQQYGFPHQTQCECGK